VLAAEATASAEARATALQELYTDMSAASSRATACSLWATWGHFHDQWFGQVVEVLPLTQEKIFAVAACFKKGGYRAWPSYASKAKEQHILTGNVWDLQLDFAVRKATASVMRGLGVARQSTPFDLGQCLEAVRGGEVALKDSAPVGWGNFLVTATYFIMREIEVANSKVEHVTVLHRERKVQLLLPVSKKDPRAVGCLRSWQCLCKQGAAAAEARHDCPFHAITGQLALLREHFGDPLPEGLPLFPTAAGVPAAKTAIVEALETTVQAYGAPVALPNGAKLLGGHSFRVTGAQRLAALGVEVVKIMVLARWAGETVLRYIRDAPLDNLPAEVRALEEKRNLFTALEKLQAEVRGIDSKVDAQKGEAERIAHELFARFGPAVAKPYIANGNRTRFKVHVAAVDGVESLPQNWKTKCGVKFGAWAFTRHATKDAFPADTWCAKCFDQGGSGRRAAASSTDSSAVGSEGSSSEVD
jgi:hypothetical protein